MAYLTGENYSNAFYYTLTKENHHLKTYIKFDIKSEIAALKEEHKTYII